jgi:hypothetical protein
MLGDVHLEYIRDRAQIFPSVTKPDAVRTLRIWHCGYVTLSPISQLTQLRGLEIAGYPNTSLEILAGLRELRYLRILHLPEVTALTTLRNLTSLVTLRLDTLPSWDSSRRKTTVESLIPLARLTALEHIELLGIVPLDGSLAPLEACSSLKTGRFHLIPEAEVARFFTVSAAKNAFSPSTRVLIGVRQRSDTCGHLRISGLHGRTVGDGWVNGSGLATLQSHVGSSPERLVRRLAQNADLDFKTRPRLVSRRAKHGVD